MKGFTNIIWAALLIVIALIAISTFSIAGSTVQLEDVKTVTKTIKMKNALEGAEVYLDAALGYAFHQGCYDTLRAMDAKWTNQEFLDALEKAVLKNMKKYTDKGFLFGGEAVILPSYTDLTLTFQQDTRKNTVRITSKGTQIIGTREEFFGRGGFEGPDFIAEEEKGWVYKEIVELKKEVTLDKTVKSDCKGIFSLGKIITSNVEKKKDNIRVFVGNIRKTTPLTINTNNPLDCQDFFADTTTHVQEGFDLFYAEEGSGKRNVDIKKEIEEIVKSTIGIKPAGIAFDYEFEKQFELGGGGTCRVNIPKITAHITVETPEAYSTETYPIQDENRKIRFAPLQAKIVVTVEG